MLRLVLWRRFTTSTNNKYARLNETLVRLGGAGATTRGKNHNTKDLTELEETVLRTPNNEFNEVNTATALHLLGRGKTRNQQCVQKLLEIAQTQTLSLRELTNLCQGLAYGKLTREMPSFVARELAREPPNKLPARALANIIWSYATLQDASQCDALANTLLRRGAKDFNAQDVSNVVWSLAHLKYFGNVRVNERVLAARVMAMDLQAFNAQGLSNTLWGLAKLEMSPELRAQLAKKFAKELLKQDARVLATLLPKHLATCLSSLAVMLPNEAEERRALAQAFSKELRARERQWSLFSSQDLAQLCSSFAKLAERDILPALSQEVVRRGVEHFNEQDLAEIVWAFATMRLAAPTLFNAIAAQVPQRRPGLHSAQAMSTILWSFARLELVQHTTLFTSICKRVLKLDDNALPPRERATIIHSLAKLRHEDLQMCQHLTRDLSNLGTAHDVSNMALGLAQLNYRDAQVMDALAQRALELWPTLSYQHVINLGWAFCCCDAQHVPAVRAFFDQHQLPASSTNSLEINQQIAQISLAAAEPERNLVKALRAGVPAPASSAVELHAISNVHLMVHDLFKRRLGAEVKFEYELAPGIFVDLFVPKLGLVVEVDGPQHFFVNQPSVLLGKKQFKDRLVERASASRVVHLRSNDFFNLPPARREEEVERLLGNAGSGA